MTTLTELPIRLIAPNPANPRTNLGDLTGLAASMRTHGVLQPIVVRPLPNGRYQVIAGHRRLAAAPAAGLTHLPAVIRTERTSGLVAAIIENGHRAGLTPIEQAQAFGKLRNAGHTSAAIANATGYSEAHISTRLALLDLDEATLGRIQRGVLSADDALVAVRAVRGAAGRPAAGHFSDQHPLAEHARERCAGRGHKRRPYGRVACGPCWEDTIRADAVSAHGTPLRSAS